MRTMGKISGHTFKGLLPAVFFMLVAVSVMIIPAASRAGEMELKEEIDKIWTKLANIESATGVAESGEVESRWADRVTIGGVVEVEGTYVDGEKGDSDFAASDIALATVELGIDAEVSDYSSAHVLFLYEDGEDISVDEAFITLGDTEKFPLYLTAGRMYVPFGNYETQMVSDPLTLEIGETQEDAAQFGIEVAGIYASAYTFNGDTDNGGHDVVEHGGAAIGYSFESEVVSLNVGGGWISDIRDTNGLTEAMGGAPVAVSDYIDGYAAHFVGSFGPVNLIGEYVGADDDLFGAGTESQISAYNLEIGLFFPIGKRSASFGIGYQETDDALWAELPEKRIIAALAFEIMEGTSLALEWYNDEDYEVVDGGTGTDWDVYTLQLAAEF